MPNTLSDIASSGMRAGDSDRELVVLILREQHLAGRLGSDEFERRLEHCLAATSHAELHAITADLPTHRTKRAAIGGTFGPRVAVPGERAIAGSTRRLLRNLVGLIAIHLLVIWALTGGGYFWPAWAWFGLSLPLGLHASLRWAWRRPAGAERRVLVLRTLLVSLEGACIVVWLLSAMSGSLEYFWPVWPLLGFVTIAATHSALGARASLFPK